MKHNTLFLNLQWTLQRKLSQFIGIVFDCQWRVVKNPIIWIFIKWYRVDLSEYYYTVIKDYKSANDFFIRRLKDKTRGNFENKEVIGSPVDGYISQMGAINGQTLVQAKQRTYTLSDLLAKDEDLVQLFQEGHFLTLYLAPKDYHRVHMPISGVLQQMIYVPGWLFSVGPRNTERVSQLFTRNERVISIFKTPNGPMAIILVGSLLVGSLATAWHENIISRTSQTKIQKWDYQNQDYALDRMADMGYFKLGSTVILLFGKEQVKWAESLHLDQRVHLNQPLGKINSNNDFQNDAHPAKVSLISEGKVD